MAQFWYKIELLGKVFLRGLNGYFQNPTRDVWVFFSGHYGEGQFWDEYAALFIHSCVEILED